VPLPTGTYNTPPRMGPLKRVRTASGMSGPTTFVARAAAHGEDGAAPDPVLSIGQILLAQLAVAGAPVAPLWLWRGEGAAVSWLLGGVICVVPNAFVGALMSVRRDDARAALRAAWLGEAGKLVLTVALFVAAFTKVGSLHAGLLFGGLIATQSVSLFALLFDKGKKASS
jgi:ATP synthase protein I